MMMNENRIGTYPSKVDCTKSVVDVHEEENNPGLGKKRKEMSQYQFERLLLRLSGVDLLEDSLEYSKNQPKKKRIQTTLRIEKMKKLAFNIIFSPTQKKKCQQQKSKKVLVRNTFVFDNLTQHTYIKNPDKRPSRFFYSLIMFFMTSDSLVIIFYCQIWIPSFILYMRACIEFKTKQNII